MSLLAVDDLSVRYGHVEAVRGVSFSISHGEAVAFLGRNGAGKSSLLAGIMNTVRERSGQVLFDNAPTTGCRTHELVRRGLVLVREGHGVLSELSVQENLRMAAWALPRAERAAAREEILEMFPRLAQRRRQSAGSLSGGEQQMLALANARILRPKLLMLDEPSLGLAPVIVDEVYDWLIAERHRGLAILLVEQLSGLALAVSDRAVVLDRGRITESLSAAEGRANEGVLRSAYMGGPLDRRTNGGAPARTQVVIEVDPRTARRLGNEPSTYALLARNTCSPHNGDRAEQA